TFGSRRVCFDGPFPPLEAGDGMSNRNQDLIAPPSPAVATHCRSQLKETRMRRVCRSLTLVALLVCCPLAAGADVALHWNEIAVNTLVSLGQSPFAQARFMAITQLAVFEAVTAIPGDSQPYLGTVVAPAGASTDAAAGAAGDRGLKNNFPAGGTPPP